MNWPVVGWPTQTEANPEYWPSPMQRTELFTQAAWGQAGEPQVNLGYKWTLRRTPADNFWTSVCWSPELRLFCAVAQSGTGNRVMTSPTGEFWTASAASSDASWESVCWSRELGIFCAVSSEYNGFVMTSPNGKTWTQTASLLNASLIDVCWSPELRLFCAVGASFTTGKSVIYTSTNAQTWTQRTYPWTANANDGGAFGVCWSPYLGMFVIVSNNAGVPPESLQVFSTSTDGISWTGRSNSDRTFTAPKILWLSGLNLFVQYDRFTTTTSISRNGLSWSSFSAGISSPSAMAWCPGIGRLVACFAAGNTRFRLTRNPEVGAVGWSQQVYPNIRGTPLNWRSICYAPELRRLVAVGSNGTGTRVATSP